MTGSQQLILGEGAGGSGVANYIEDVFSTWLYAGNGSTQTITNGIDLSGKGGLVWFKYRAGPNGPANHQLYDTARGVQKKLATNTSGAEATELTGLTAFNANGFSFGSDGNINASSSDTYASWTFRKQPKFFDVVTYTGDGTNNRQISHSLGSAPGFIIVKNITNAQSWVCYHRSLGTANFVILNSPNIAGADANAFPTVTSTFFVPTANESAFTLNTSGNTFVVYLFAHDAGGFGLTGTDNVISCGSYTGNGSSTGPSISLGYEPQWLMVKRAVGGTSAWNMYDTVRGMPVPTSPTLALQANLAGAEYTGPNNFVAPNASGFNITSTSSDVNTNGDTYIYIAIRRGPMKTPTSGTSVFYPQTVSQSNTINSTNVPFPPDLVNTFSRNGTDRTAIWQLFSFVDRLRGLGVPSNTYTLSGPTLIASSTNAEDTGNGAYVQMMADGQNINRSSGWNDPAYGNWIYYFMRRAPGFMDIVCYTGNSAGGRTISHNLGVAPEMMIVKCRSAVGRPFSVYSANVGAAYAANFDSSAGFFIDASYWNNTNPTSSVFTVGISSRTNTSGETYVAYLFASCPGVSKVGSYTGTGALQTINCGFTGGARWVMIKRSDSTGGDWYVYDSARGITSGNDPYLLLNSNAAEVTGTNYVDTASTGFQVTATAPAGLNASGGTYIFLAIA